jgi:hypothetical protein
MVPPLINSVSGFVKGSEPVLIQAFVPEFAIEALDKRILGGLTWLDKPKLYPSISGPEVHGFAGEFTAVVHGDHSRQPPCGSQLS